MTRQVKKGQVLQLQFISPLVNLSVGLFLGEAIFLLEFSSQNVPAAIDLQEFVIRQLAPLLLDFAAELLPLASDLFPLIGRLRHDWFPFMS